MTFLLKLQKSFSKLAPRTEMLMATSISIFCIGFGIESEGLKLMLKCFFFYKCSFWHLLAKIWDRSDMSRFLSLPLS